MCPQLSLLAIALLASLPNTSCDNSTSSEFEEVNGKTEKKRLQSVSVISQKDPADNKTVIFNYDNNKRLNAVTDGQETYLLLYINGELTSAADQYGTITMEELYSSPYDAYETGQVADYDSNGNPARLLFFEREYDYITDTFSIQQYSLEISYDDKPNPFYYSLETAGIIDVLDQVKFNFSMAPQAAEILRAKALFPLNNPSQFVYKNEAGQIVHAINLDYSYEGDYPTSGTAVAVSPQQESTGTFSINFQYAN